MDRESFLQKEYAKLKGEIMGNARRQYQWYHESGFVIANWYLNPEDFAPSQTQMCDIACHLGRPADALQTVYEASSVTTYGHSGGHHYPLSWIINYIVEKGLSDAVFNEAEQLIAASHYSQSGLFGLAHLADAVGNTGLSIKYAVMVNDFEFAGDVMQKAGKPRSAMKFYLREGNKDRSYRCQRRAAKIAESIGDYEKAVEIYVSINEGFFAVNIALEHISKERAIELCYQTGQEWRGNWLKDPKGMMAKEMERDRKHALSARQAGMNWRDENRLVTAAVLAGGSLQDGQLLDEIIADALTMTDKPDEWYRIGLKYATRMNDQERKARYEALLAGE